MKLTILILLLLVYYLGYSKGFDYDEGDIRTLVKRQAIYYNNYDYYGETTTVATTKKKLIKKCPTNAAGKRIKCKKKKKKTTTTTEEPPPIPASFLRGPPGISPISFFLGPEGARSILGLTTTTKSTTTYLTTNSTIKPKTFGGTFGLPIIMGSMLPTGSPKNSTFSHMPAALSVSRPSLNLSAPGDNLKLSPAGAMQIGFLPKMMKSYNSSATTNDDPIVSGSPMDATTPLSLTTTGLISKLGSLTAPILSSGTSFSSLNSIIPNASIAPQILTTTAKPAGLSNVSIFNPTTTMATTSVLRLASIPNSTLTIPAQTSTTSSPNMGSLLGRIQPAFGLPASYIAGNPTTLQSTSILPTTVSTSTSSLTTVPSNMGSFLGRIALPPRPVLQAANTETAVLQTVLPSTTAATSTSTSKFTSVLPILGITPAQSNTASLNSTIVTSTAKLGLLLPLLPGGTILSTTTSFPSSTISTSTAKSSLTISSTATSSKTLITTIRSAANKMSTTKSNGVTKKKSSKTTKKKAKKNKRLKKKKKTKKTTKKAGNQQGNNERKKQN